MTHDQVVEELKRRAKRAGSILALAHELNVSSTYLWHVINGRQKPGPLILRALGLEAATSYEKSKGGKP